LLEAVEVGGLLFSPPQALNANAAAKLVVIGGVIVDEIEEALRA
jgi:hypothetical protein